VAAEVDVFDHRVGTQLGGLEVTVEAAAVALGELAVHQQPEAFLKGQALVGGGGGLFGETGGHGREFEGVQTLDGGVIEHVLSFHW
jgi:hypothetical protein